MVNAIHANQPGLPGNGKVKALESCRSFLTLAAECLALYRPALIITHGLPGSGKTTFAQAALERLQAIRIRSDVERKRLFGLLPLADSRSHPNGIYGSDATELTYVRVHELARELLMAGVPVIVDAASLKQDGRAVPPPACSGAGGAVCDRVAPIQPGYLARAHCSAAGRVE